MCFGYVVVENPLPGKYVKSMQYNNVICTVTAEPLNCRLLVDKLKELGVPPGPVYSQLKRGETITTADGRQVSPAEVLAPPRPGRKLVFLGDTADSSSIASLAAGADVIVHEATNECAHEEKARANGHSTPGQQGNNSVQLQCIVYPKD